MANVNPNNQVTIQGRLGQMPELRFTNGDEPKAVLNLSVAISNDWYDDKKCDWVKVDPTWMNVTVWGDAAERLVDKLAKGTLVRVMGKLNTRKRTVKQEVTLGTGKSAKTGEVEFTFTEVGITSSSVQIIPSQGEASNSTVSRQNAPVAAPDF
jgi:single stranded DNA-binding protein